MRGDSRGVGVRGKGGGSHGLPCASIRNILGEGKKQGRVSAREDAVVSSSQTSQAAAPRVDGLNRPFCLTWGTLAGRLGQWLRGEGGEGGERCLGRDVGMMGKAGTTSTLRQLLMEELSSTEVIFSRSQSPSRMHRNGKRKVRERANWGEKDGFIFCLGSLYLLKKKPKPPNFLFSISCDVK